MLLNRWIDFGCIFHIVWIYLSAMASSWGVESIVKYNLEGRMLCVRRCIDRVRTRAGRLVARDCKFAVFFKGFLNANQSSQFTTASGGFFEETWISHYKSSYSVIYILRQGWVANKVILEKSSVKPEEAFRSSRNYLLKKNLKGNSFLKMAVVLQGQTNFVTLGALLENRQTCPNQTLFCQNHNYKLADMFHHRRSVFLLYNFIHAFPINLYAFNLPQQRHL